MKLGKSLIITGLLFSSVLGSVNVNNITAMAAEVTPPAPVADEHVKVKYMDQNNEEIKDDEFVTNTTQKFATTDINQAYTLDNLEKLPANYELGTNEKTTRVKENATDKSHYIEVKVNRLKVKAVYKNKSGQPVTSTSLNDLVDVKNPGNAINKDSFDAIPNYIFYAYASGIVTFKESTSVATKTVTIKFTDKNKIKKFDDKTMDIAQDATNVAIPKDKIPTGYRLVSKDNNFKVEDKLVNVLVEKIPSRGGHRGYALQRVRISFVDQDGDEVGYKQLNGKDTFSSKIEAPAGYTLVNSSDATIKFNKKGNKDIKIKVTKNRPTPVMEKGIVTTNSGLYFHLYTIDGKEITNRGLSGDSKWFTDQYATINGEKMFRVATNEWVKATDVYK